MHVHVGEGHRPHAVVVEDLLPRGGWTGAGRAQAGVLGLLVTSTLAAWVSCFLLTIVAPGFSFSVNLTVLFWGL